MADWFVISDSNIDPDAPVTSELAYAWRDNPVAMAEGASGAPRIRSLAVYMQATASSSSLVIPAFSLSGLGAASVNSMYSICSGTVRILTGTVNGGAANMLLNGSSVQSRTAGNSFDYLATLNKNDVISFQAAGADIVGIQNIRALTTFPSFGMVRLVA